MQLRAIEPGDLEQVAALSAELGYPIAPDLLAANLATLAASSDHLARAAVVEGRVAGWIHAGLNRAVFERAWVEIEGLVVSAACRGRGVGAALLRAAEGWARAQGVREVRLGCRVSRAEAHRFYERMGYRISKTQHRFARTL